MHDDLVLEDQEQRLAAASVRCWDELAVLGREVRLVDSVELDEELLVVDLDFPAERDGV